MGSARLSIRPFWRTVPTEPREHVFWFGSRGCIFTSPCFAAGNTTRHRLSCG
jgi:hypothetical protein